MNGILRQKNKLRAFTLIECMIVLLILMITFTGIMSFRYYAVLSAQRAETELLAAQTAVVLSEAWRALKGTEDFDPTQYAFDDSFLIQSGSVSAFSGASLPGFNYLGNYQVQIEGRRFNASLVYENSSDVSNMRILHVILAWQDTNGLEQTFHLSTLSQT